MTIYSLLVIITSINNFINLSFEFEFSRIIQRFPFNHQQKKKVLLKLHTVNILHI